MRSSNIELLRILSIFFILILHVVSMSDILYLNNFNSIIIKIFSSFGEIGVSCFILISGYFGIKRNWNKILHLILITTLYSVLVYISIPLNSFSVTELFKALFVVPMYTNWFISCYLIVLVLSPYLEIFVKSLSKRQFEGLLLTLFVCFSILPTLFNTPYYTIITAGGKCLSYFLFLYLIGRYIQLYFNKNISRNKTISVFLISTFIINVLNFSAALILNKQVFVYSMDCSPFILISSLSAFFYFKSLDIQYKLINTLSSSIIAVYLLDGTRIFWNYHIFHIEQYKNSVIFSFVLLSEVVFCFVISIIIDKVRIILFSKLENKIIKFTIDNGNIALKSIIKHKL